LDTSLQMPVDTLNPQGFDRLAAGLAAAEGGRIRIDLSACNFIDPFGIVGLLFLLRHAASHYFTVICDLPKTEAVREYLNVMGLFRQAGEYAVFNPAPAEDGGENIGTGCDFALALTPIRSEDDVAAVVRELIVRVRTILTRNLQYNSTLLNKICVALAEICQNIPQHSGDWGMVALQSYRSRNGRGDRFVKLAVGDLGIGIKNSLVSRPGSVRMSDSAAIRAALRFGISRFGEPGRGLGLAAVAAQAKALGGSLQVRSGRARVLLRGPKRYIFDVPYFPGTLVSLELPAQQLFILSGTDTEGSFPNQN
jgi:hypothetical protein